MGSKKDFEASMSFYLVPSRTLIALVRLIDFRIESGTDFNMLYYGLFAILLLFLLSIDLIVGVAIVHFTVGEEISEAFLVIVL